MLEVINEGGFGPITFKYVVKRDGVVVASSSNITLADDTSTTIPIHYTSLNTQDDWSLRVSVLRVEGAIGTHTATRSFVNPIGDDGPIDDGLIFP